MKKTQQILSAFDTPLTPTMTVKRVFPNKALKNVDPFVFLDHFGPGFHDLETSPFAKGTGAHPHRGFCTFTYLLDGEMEHKDSRGHRGMVGPGGVQWMKAASGIVHDEKPPLAFLEKGGLLHGFQLWINLPKANKEDTPAYFNLQADQVPVAELSAHSTARVLIGTYMEAASPVPMHSPMLVLHVRLGDSDPVTVNLPEGWNAFAYVPVGTATVGGDPVQGGQMAQLTAPGQDIELYNPNTAPVDVMLFAGQPIGESIFTSGPFVMNDPAGVQRAYDDFYAGKYGEIAV